jgi:hypothetical protein
MKKIKLTIRFEDVYPQDDGNLKKGGVHQIPYAVNPQFDNGDEVNVFNSGYCYSSYRVAAIACGLITVEESLKMKDYYMSCISGQTGKIIGCCRHENEPVNIYGLLLSDGKCTLVGERGLRLIKKTHLQEDLFEI